MTLRELIADKHVNIDWEIVIFDQWTGNEYEPKLTTSQRRLFLEIDTTPTEDHKAGHDCKIHGWSPTDYCPYCEGVASK